MKTETKFLNEKNVNSFVSRIKANPKYMEFDNNLCLFEDNISEEPVFDFKGLNDHEKLALFVYSFTEQDFVVFKRTIRNYFKWTDYKIRKLRKEINNEKSNYSIDIETCFSEDDGTISGRGYQFYI